MLSFTLLIVVFGSKIYEKDKFEMHNAETENNKTQTEYTIHNISVETLKQGKNHRQQICTIQ